jgi:hypothetical protein
MMKNFFSRCQHAGRVLVGRDKVDGLLKCPHLDVDAIERLKEEIADKTVERLENKIYLRIGKGVAHKILWLIGLGTVSLVTWLHSKGMLP